jgi:hypothetical protein
MKRKALIIGASPDSDYLAGVARDVKNWENFLLSPVGGSWRNSEVKVLREPTKAEALNASAWMEDSDYGKIIFIGHGYIEDDELGSPVTFFNLNEDEVVSERELNPRTPWFIQIMDCCRKYIPVEEAINFSKISASVLALNEDTARSLYDTAISRSEKGLVRMYAADLSQGAADEESFSDVLIRQALKWSRGHSGILDSKHAFELVRQYLQESNPQQTPVHNAGRRHRYFPVAVGGQS